MPVRLSPEYRLLADCIRREPGVDSELASVRWPRFGQIATRHRLAARAHDRLLSWGCQDAVPSGVMNDLEREHIETTALYLARREALRPILETLAAGSVPVMLLKGAALVATGCTEGAVRPMVDLDLLVPPAALDRADELLQGLGYRRGDVEPRHLDRMLTRHHQHLPPLISPDHTLSVELHHHLVAEGRPWRFDLDGMWAQAQPLPALAQAVAPAPEDLVTHVAIQFVSQHSWTGAGGLGRLADVADVVGSQADGFDWDRWCATAKARHVEGPVFLALAALKELVSSNGLIPRPAVDSLRPKGWPDEWTRSFVRLRLLRTRPWLAAGSVRPRNWTYSTLVPSPTALRHRHHLPPGLAPLGSQYLRSLAQAGLVAGSVAGRPWEVVEDQRLNRRLRRLRG